MQEATEHVCEANTRKVVAQASAASGDLGACEKIE